MKVILYGDKLMPRTSYYGGIYSFNKFINNIFIFIFFLLRKLIIDIWRINY